MLDVEMFLLLTQCRPWRSLPRLPELPTVVCAFLRRKAGAVRGCAVRGPGHLMAPCSVRFGHGLILRGVVPGEGAACAWPQHLAALLLCEPALPPVRDTLARPE